MMLQTMLLAVAVSKGPELTGSREIDFILVCGRELLCSIFVLGTLYNVVSRGIRTAFALHPKLQTWMLRVSCLEVFHIVVLNSVSGFVSWKICGIPFDESIPNMYRTAGLVTFALLLPVANVVPLLCTRFLVRKTLRELSSDSQANVVCDKLRGFERTLNPLVYGMVCFSILPLTVALRNVRIYNMVANVAWVLSSIALLHEDWLSFKLSQLCALQRKTQTIQVVGAC
jgi:hypothetical protein